MTFQLNNATARKLILAPVPEHDGWGLQGALYSLCRMGVCGGDWVERAAASVSGAVEGPEPLRAQPRMSVSLVAVHTSGG